MSPAIPHLARAAAAALVACLASVACGGPGAARAETRLFLDEHHLDPGTRAADVAAAHQKDLAVQAAHGVSYERYWVDEAAGTVFCLVRAPSAQAAEDVHREAHGLVAERIDEVQPGILPAPASGRRLFLDTHEVGPGLHAADVAEAHRQDLAVQAGHDVRFLDYWVDEADGRIHCLAEAPDAAAVVATHREAHGLLPDAVQEVVAGR